MLNLLIMFSSMTLITLMMTFIAHFFPKRKPKLEKSSPYECGFDPLNLARMPFSFRFFLIAMLFLLFDLEMALLLPLPSSLFLFNPKISSLLLTLFLMMLCLGLFYEWIKGGLDWAN